MRLLENRFINKELWNRSVENSSFPTIFADYDILTLASPGWKALVLGEYEYVMPLPTKAKLGVKYVYTPFFMSQLGIFSKNEITPEVTMLFFNSIPYIYRQIDLLLAPGNYSDNSLINPIEMHTYQMRLNRPYVLLEQRFSENTKRNIKAAEKAGLTYTTQLSVGEVIGLFKNGRGKDKSIRYNKKDYRLLEEMAGCASKKGMLDIVGVRDDEGRLLAGALFLRDYQCIRFWFSGRDYRFPEKKAMFFLLNEYLKVNEKQDLLFDFNGSMNENVARFYKGFGGEQCSFPFVNLRRYSYLSPFIKMYKTIIKQEKS
ncbi:GNAT family N-acetyltransferase [Bacteroidales bacterium OttesenSCG-928-E04]|nr:GNAT family N-acetyltransferase [Bacteroidales bacterium OttesenSCG-928-E04]